MRFRRTLFLLLPLLLMFGSASAQTPDIGSMGGRLYIVAFPDTVQNTFDTRYPNTTAADTLSLYIYSPVATRVRITGNGYTENVNVQAARFAETHLNRSKLTTNLVVDSSNVESPNVFRLESNDPVIVYCYITTPFGSEAWTPLPVESWGREYIAAAMPGEIVRNIRGQLYYDYLAGDVPAPAELTIISAYNNTQITVTPTDTGVFAGRPQLSFILSANRAYQLQTVVDSLTAVQGLPQIDLTGARITSNQPVGVMSGNTRSLVTADSIVGLARNSMRNMLMESLPPVEQFGKEFVATPVMDDRAMTSGPDPFKEKRKSELVRIVTATVGTNVERVGDTTGSTGNYSIPPLSFDDDTLTGVSSARARRYRTTARCEAFYIPSPVSKRIDSTNVEESYEAWGGFMVEMTPREQWTTFAPYIATLNTFSAPMRHYVNIVTDTTSRLKIFDENNSVVSGWKTIPGTDLCWTTRSITPGVTRYFKSNDTAARFSGYVYGLMKGREVFRPRVNSDYEEYIGVSYAYPISPRRLVLRQSDSLIINTSGGCDSMLVLVKAFNSGAAVGFKSIELVAGSVNTRLVFRTPATGDVLGKDTAAVLVTAIDKLAPASATLRITDRTGKVTDIPYTYEAERVDISAAGSLDYGEVSAGLCFDTNITVHNPLDRPVSIVGLITSTQGGQGFNVLYPTPLPTPADPLVLQAGQSVELLIRFCPDEKNKVYRDTLRVKLGCTELTLPIHAESVEPCVYVDDLNFGTFVLGQDGPKTLPLSICNQGRGEVRFRQLPGLDSVLWWLTKNFSVPRSTIDSLRHAVLGPTGSGTECFRIWVTFTPEAEGLFITTAHFSTSTDCLRDSSVWRATVVGSSGVEWSSVAEGAATLRPTPARDKAEVELTLRTPHEVKLTVIDARGEVVQRSTKLCSAGRTLLALELGELPDGLYYCTVTAGAATQTLPLVIAR